MNDSIVNHERFSPEQFEQAASTIRNEYDTKKVVFAKIDCVEERKLLFVRSPDIFIVKLIDNSSPSLQLISHLNLELINIQP